MKDGCSWENCPASVPENGRSLKYVFVKDIACGKWVSSVGFTAVHKEQVFEESKLTDRIVRSFNGLLTFKTAYTNTDVRSVNHIDIVCTVSNSQSCFVLISVPDHKNYFCLLLRTHATSKHNRGPFTEVDKLFFDILIRLNEWESFTSYNHCIFRGSLRLTLFVLEVRELVFDLIELDWLHNKHVHWSF